jgi:hypothetical protein
MKVRAEDYSNTLLFAAESQQLRQGSSCPSAALGFRIQQ